LFVGLKLPIDLIPKALEGGRGDATQGKDLVLGFDVFDGAKMRLIPFVEVYEPTCLNVSELPLISEVVQLFLVDRFL
jgi:hypothetical protein